jgi:asparagine synthetase B (glutamine-hydrolysing)
MSSATSWRLRGKGVGKNIAFPSIIPSRARIRQLVKPLRTELDDSLGCALWFAARGQGRLLGQEASYTSTAPVLLVGSGADEQLGGYSRHRVAFAKGGRLGLEKFWQQYIFFLPSKAATICWARRLRWTLQDCGLGTWVATTASLLT